jgi:hypothetical protein
MNGMTLTWPQALTSDDRGKAVTELRTYFGVDTGEPFTGAFFEGLGMRAESAGSPTADWSRRGESSLERYDQMAHSIPSLNTSGMSGIDLA